MVQYVHVLSDLYITILVTVVIRLQPAVHVLDLNYTIATVRQRRPSRALRHMGTGIIIPVLLLVGRVDVNRYRWVSYYQHQIVYIYIRIYTRRYDTTNHVMSSLSSVTKNAVGIYRASKVLLF